MAVLYLTEQGSQLRKEGPLLTVTKDGQALEKVPAGKVEQVIVFGTIGITTPALHYLLEAGIDCVFCSRHGRYHGRLVANESGYGALRQQQYAAATDLARRRAIARAIVRGKVGNQRTLLQRFARDHPNEALANAVGGLGQALVKVERAEDIGTLLGIEGVAAGWYYQGLRTILKEDLGFRVRARRPPPDPVNSMLSLGYTLLVYAVQSAVRIVGLDPFIGYLHVTAYSRPSLVLDLMEEFRPLIVDSVVIRMINTGMIDAGDFERPESGKYPVVLRQAALKRFIAEFEKRVQTEVQHPFLRGTHTYRRSFELQARVLARALRGEIEDYRPFLTK